jgi:hypothetical protein
MVENREMDAKSPMGHVWLGMEQPAVGEAILLLRQTFGLTRAKLIDLMSEVSGSGETGPDTSLVYRWEKGRIGRGRPTPGSRRRLLLSSVCEREIKTLDTHSRREFLAALTSIAGVPWIAGLVDDLLHANVAVDRVGARSVSAGTLRSGTSRPRRAISSADVDAIAELSSVLRGLDNKFGGGYVYSMATNHLENAVLPMLRQGSYSEGVGQRLYSAAAEMAHLAGWMAYDIELATQAERHFGHALQLAAAAGDDAFSAEILAGMSHQAIHGDRPTDGVDMAKAAQRNAARAGLPALLAEAFVMEAHAHARLGDRRESGRSLHRAELAFGRPFDGDLPAWLSYFDSAYLAAKFAHCFRDLRDWRAAERYARRSLDMDNGFARGRMFNTVLLATTYVDADLGEACAIGLGGVEMAGHLQSARTIQYVRDLQRRLHARWSRDPRVRQFDERVADLAGRSGQGLMP